MLTRHPIALQKVMLHCFSPKKALIVPVGQRIWKGLYILAEIRARPAVVVSAWEVAVPPPPPPQLMPSYWQWWKTILVTTESTIQER